MEDWKKTLTDILQQEVTQEAMAEGNKTPEQEAVDFIEQELSKAREGGRKEVLKEVEYALAKDLRYELRFTEIQEVLSKLKDNK